MSRVLAYCGFQQDDSASLPATGVNGSPIEALALDALRLLWSNVEWPFAPAAVQKNAVEFHGVIQHIFRERAVIPFRLLSVFDNKEALAAFAHENQERFLADMERLKLFVQMECVIYPAPAQRAPVEVVSGKAYLEQRAEGARSIAQAVSSVREAVRHLSHDVRVREAKNGSRMFVLVERGREQAFREAIQQVVAPERLSRRISGPWPAAEFLSAWVKVSQIAEGQ